MTNVHIGLNVKDLKESTNFYVKMLGAEPVKVKEDYVKFLIQNPNLNLTLTQSEQTEGNQINHLGIQVESREAVMAHKERLEKEGFFAREEMDTTCCYAVQDKFWVTDPNGIEWEYFYTKAESDIKIIQTIE
ncbi:ArsI/CadI family heavy metal resistance metalloenzyme [Saliterribacillus persicus]|uniref:Lactoylglutathione lyase n=1 Tax=Saliterribacillus persicus TaxID=930114 RepID=A0A368XNV0_9BACI|nr:ArsI/CadI family heavy metal resistance metalloenzyme [Saliterribacillus persicus]RCW69692.1 lactoylglutathione lyase [Saliterribacillus persicus]